MSKADAKPTPIRNCILVLGMHRSGTSALAGVLSLLGCATPASLIRGDANNEKGYFESNAVGRLSDAILSELGSAWSDWLSLELESLPRKQYLEFCNRTRQIIQDDFAEASLFVLKEPRMCRMAPFWLSALEDAGCKVNVVHTHRNPQEVAASLARRDGFEPAFGLLLWLRHVLDAEHATRGRNRVFTSYRHLMQDWRTVTGTLESALGLAMSPGDPDAIDSFLSAKLQHFSDTTADTLANPALPHNVRETFAIMERWAETGEQQDDYTMLDTLRAELDAQSVAFAPLVRPGQMALLALAETQADLDSAKARIHELNSEKDTWRPAIEEAAQLRADLAEKEADLLRLHKDIQERDRLLEILSRNLDRMRADLAAKEAEALALQQGTRERDSALEAQAQTLDQLRADNMHLYDNVMRAEARYQAMLQSSSWRLTAPLRNVSGLLRRGPKSS